MKELTINSIEVQNEGVICCKSAFYSVQDELSTDSSYNFSKCVNKLIGEIDSGNWAISYLLSMYKYRPDDFILFKQSNAIVNNKFIVSLDELSESSCYMDKIYPLFSNNNSIKDIVSQGLKDNKMNYSCNEIRELFHIDIERFNRPLTGVGNEIFKAMAAIGYCYKKEIFCFPWLSNKRFERYYENLSNLLCILEELNKIVILPIGVAE